MNPITIILILSIVLGVSLILNIVATVLLNKSRKEISEACLELVAYDNKCEQQKTIINQYANSINEKDTEIGKQKEALKQYDFKFNEQIRLNNESEQSLKDIISEHDSDMRKQREKFEKFASELHDKGTVIEFVKQAFKAGKANVFKLEDYIKEFKANL